MAVAAAVEAEEEILIAAAAASAASLVSPLLSLVVTAGVRHYCRRRRCCRGSPAPPSLALERMTTLQLHASLRFLSDGRGRSVTSVNNLEERPDRSMLFLHSAASVFGETDHHLLLTRRSI